MFFNPDVKRPAIIRIRPWPRANKNSIIIARDRFLPIAAKAIIPARIGVEQGVPASAKTIPKSMGYKKTEWLVFCGIAFINVGVSNSNISRSFKPITKSNDAIISVKYPPNDDENTLPVNAQAIPISVNTIAVPKMKQHNCKNVLNGVSLEYPPTYPIINGNIAREQGDIEAIIPPTKDAINNKYQAAPLENISAKLSINLFLHIIF